MKNKIIALSVLLSILSGGCVNMQQSKDLLTIDVTKDYPQKEFALQDIFDIDYIPLDTSRTFTTMGYMQDISKDMIIVRNLKLSSDGDIFISKKANEQRLPASLAKLFVIEYASTIANLDDIVSVSTEALAMTKAGSSVANIQEKDYFLHNLFAAMLVPSGNDAAYVVADYCGGILSSQANSSEERVRIFMEKLNGYLQENGYKNTVLYDPSGFDMSALTTVLDIKAVVDRLLEKDWFRDIISQHSYTATLPDTSTQTWKNTNTFLDPESDYYNKNVIGVKTGSLSDDYNLVVLYQQHGKEFLICSLGSQSNSSRYDDVTYIIKTIDESNSLAH